MTDNNYLHFSRDDGYPVVELDSDSDCRAESSDDEIDVILRGTPEQKRRLRRRSLGLDSSSEDEFEKEMAQELEQTMKTLTEQQKTASLPEAENNSKGKQESEKQLYDSSYFDSDSDEEETSHEKSQKEHPVISNDDLLYDPGIDDDNQRWVDRQRRRYQPRQSRTMDTKGQSLKVKPLPHSDAVLNCPACMTLLCLDCQRHTTYTNQYRAMFVMNCRVESGETLKFPEQAPKTSKKKQKKNKKKKTSMADSSEYMDPEQGTSTDQTHVSGLQNEPMEVTDDVFNPVKCTICKTEVGVYDSDEVYHFFNVLSSYS